MIDAIVFTQAELNTALDNGALHILLCGPTANLPQSDGVTYTSVGKSTVLADFSNFEPSYPLSDREPCSYSSSYRFGSHTTSYTASYVSSYLSSYLYNYRYEYRTSFFGSYRLASSYKTSFASSFAISSFIRGLRHRFHARVLKEISVNGYGIHLI